MLEVSKLVFELSSAQNELKKGGTDERRLGRSSTAPHKVPNHELGRELGRSGSRLHSHGSTQPRASRGGAELVGRRRGGLVVGTGHWSSKSCDSRRRREAESRSST